MADKFNKLLSENLNLDEESQKVIQEAWDEKLSEARENIAAELREEFAQKFTHDKKLIVKSMDKFLNEQLEREIQELAEDRKKLAADRVAYKTKVSEHAKLLNSFVNSKLAEEVKAQRAERDELKNGMTVLENFVLKQLAEEIKEFQADKTALREQRVKLVREGREELSRAKKEFIHRAASVVNEAIDKSLRGELSQLKEDIQAARKNDFGHRIFEAFASEFMTSHLNEGTEIKKLQDVVSELQTKLNEAEVRVAEQKSLTESVNRKLAAAKDINLREKTLGKLMAPLGDKKRQIMTELLEGVQTQELEKKFNQYLPAVLNEGEEHPLRRNKKTKLNEDVISEKTGDRATNSAQHQDAYNVSDIEQIKRLAGL